MFRSCLNLAFTLAIDRGSMQIRTGRTKRRQKYRQKTFREIRGDEPTSATRPGGKEDELSEQERFEKTLNTETKKRFHLGSNVERTPFILRILGVKNKKNSATQFGLEELDSKRYEKAERLFEKALENNPKDIKAILGMFQIQWEFYEDEQQAKAFMLKALKTDVLAKEVYSAMEFYYSELGDTKMLNFLGKHRTVVARLRNNPQPKAFNNMGVFLTRLELFTEAANNYKKALRLDKHFSMVKYNMANCQYQRAMKERNEKNRRSYLKQSMQWVEDHLRDSKSAEGLLLKSRIYFSYETYAEALEFCEEAMSLKPGDRSIMLYKANLEQKMGRMGSAMRTFDLYKS